MLGLKDRREGRKKGNPGKGVTEAGGTKETLKLTPQKSQSQTEDCGYTN